MPQTSLFEKIDLAAYKAVDGLKTAEENDQKSVLEGLSTVIGQIEDTKQELERIRDLFSEKKMTNHEICVLRELLEEVYG